MQNIAPDYEQRVIEQSSQLTPLVTPDGEGDSLFINQDARIYRLRLTKGEAIDLSAQGNHAYLHLVSGKAEVSGNGMEVGSTVSLKQGDALGGLLEHQQHVQVNALSEDLEALWFDLP